MNIKKNEIVTREIINIVVIPSLLLQLRLQLREDGSGDGDGDGGEGSNDGGGRRWNGSVGSPDR